MNDKYQVGSTFHKKRVGKQIVMVEGPQPAAPRLSTRCLPRITRYMAIAIYYEDLIRQGHVHDYAQIASLGHVTRARNTTELSAVKQYLKILHAAKHEGLDTVDEILQSLLTSGGEMTAAAVLALIASGQQLPSPMEMDIAPPALNEFDDLFSDKDVYNEQENCYQSSQFVSPAASGGELETRLDDYDDHLGLTSTTEGSASADNPPITHASGRVGCARSVVALAVPSRADGQRVRVSESESSSEINEELAVARGQNLGAVSVVTLAPACDSAVRDSAQRSVLGSPGERLDFRQSGLGQKTMLLAALGDQLVRRGRSTLFTTCQMLVQELLRAKRDLRMERWIKKLSKFEALIIDDLGYVQQSREEMEVLFTLLSERYERGSVLLSSNLPFSKWEQIFKDPMTTAAAIDRLIHHSVIIELKIKSFRLDEAKAKATQPSPGSKDTKQVT